MSGDDTEGHAAGKLGLENGSKGSEASGRGIPFRKLTPAQSPEIVEPYREAFDFVFGHDDLCNIAVAGPYGSGKSSVVESLKRDQKYSREHKFLTISIAHFEEQERSAESEPPAWRGKADTGQSKAGQAQRRNGMPTEQELEGQVLNRLIHLMDRGSFPRSRFRKTEDASVISLVASFVVVALLLLFVFTAFNLGGILYRLPRDIVPVVQVVSTVCIVLFAGFAVARAVRRVEPSRAFRRISIRGNEVELFDRSTDSMFDRYMDDILYILERCDEDVFLFEDMDRFDNGEIFEKLRELNQIANASRKRNRGWLGSALSKLRRVFGCGGVRVEPLRFFYMVRDDMFVPDDRTKFFDFIIPVVPFIDSTNSGDELVSVFKGEGFDEGFFYEISLYIDDARILGNIVNEYKQHLSVLYGPDGDMRDGDREKLFSFVAYKNLFPADHRLLYLNSGYLHSLFVKWDELIEEISESLAPGGSGDEVIDKKRSEYIAAKFDLGDPSMVWNESIAKLADMELAELLDVPGVNPEEFFDPIRATRDADSASRDYARAVRESRSFDLVRYLLMQGYIDRSYRDFMSVFREGGVSSADREFLRDAGAGRSTDAAYAFDHPENAVSKTPKQRFAQKAYRNWSLLNALLESDRHGNGEKLAAFMAALKADVDTGFVVGYVSSDAYRKDFLAKACLYWPDMPDDVIQVWESGEGAHSAEAEKNLRVFTWRILSDGEFELGSREGDGYFTEHVRADPLILSADEEEYGDIIRGLERAGVRLSSIDEKKSDKELVKKACEGNLYELSVPMVGVMLKVVRGVSEGEVDPSVILTTIESVRDGIFDYCDGGIEALLGSVVDSVDGKTRDGEDAALWVLNRQWSAGVEGSLEVASRYARALPEKLVTDLSTIEDAKLWPSLMQGFAVKPTAKNVALYFNDHAGGALSGDLVEFINKFGVPDLSEETYKEHFADQSFALEAFASEDLESSNVESILRASKVGISNLAAYGVSLERASVAIGCGSVEMNFQNLDVVNSRYPGYIVEFIESNPAEYARIVKGRPVYVNEDVILEALASGRLAEDDQIMLAGLLRAVPPSKVYGEALNVYVIEERFNPAFVDELGALRGGASEEIGKAIDAKYVELAATGAGLGDRLPVESCRSVMEAAAARVSTSKKAVILARYVPGYDRSEVASCLASLGFENLRKVVAGEVRSAVLTDGELDDQLLDALTEKGYCGKLNKETKRLYSRQRGA